MIDEHKIIEYCQNCKIITCEILELYDMTILYSIQLLCTCDKISYCR